MHPVALVRLGADDWQEFREVRLASLADAPEAFGSTYAEWSRAAEPRWRARLADVPLTVVARSAGGPVGVVCGANVDDGSVELISMWVAPLHRGTGLAPRLIAEVVDWAGDRRIFLMVREGNRAAIKAYERAGFIDHGVPPDWPTDEPRERRMWFGEGNLPRTR